MNLPEQKEAALFAMHKLVTLVDVSKYSLEKLAELATVRTCGEGTVLFSEGEYHDQIYFVVNGSLRLEMTTTQCGRQTLLTVGAGDMLAWSAILGDGTMTSTAIVTERSQVIAIVASELKNQLERDAVFGYEIMRVIARSLSRRLLATRLQLLDLYHH